jgi:hypothetical protein
MYSCESGDVLGGPLSGIITVWCAIAEKSRVSFRRAPSLLPSLIPIVINGLTTLAASRNSLITRYGFSSSNKWQWRASAYRI